MISSVQYVEAKQTEFIPQKIFRLISPGPSLYSINFRSWVKPILTSLFIFFRGGGGEGVRRRGVKGRWERITKSLTCLKLSFIWRKISQVQKKIQTKPINPFTKLTNCKNFKLKLVHKTCIQAGTYLYRKPPTSYANIGFWWPQIKLYEFRIISRVPAHR